MIVCIILAVSVGILLIFDFMSLVFLPISYLDLYSLCNEIDLIKITNITRLDDFQCNINVIGKHIDTVINYVPCAIYDKPYNNTLVKFNHYDPNKCFDIISSKHDIPKTLKIINMIYVCWMLTLVCGSAFVLLASRQYVKYSEVGIKKMNKTVMVYDKTSP